MKKETDHRHRRSIRLPGYDYSQTGAYFITICADNRECLFGRIVNGEMILNELGLIVRAEWIKTAQLRDYVVLGEWIIMPNHFHCIIIIRGFVPPGRGAARRAPTAPIEPINNQTSAPFEQFGKPTVGSIPTIIRSFKSAVTKAVNEHRHTPGALVWQRNYYEHIIRDDEDYARIAEYIVNNPLGWENDKLFSGSEHDLLRI